MDQHAGVAEGLGHARDLLDRHALLHQVQQAVGRDLEPTGDRDAAAVGELLAQLGGVRLFETDVAPPRDRQLPTLQLGRQRLQRLGRRSLVDEMEAGLTGFLDDRFDPVDQRRSRGPLVARDVVQADVTEAAFLPVAPVRHGQLVPATVRPQPVHRIEHVQQRQVAVQRQAVPGRRADLGESHVGFDPVHVLHLAVGIAPVGAHQALRRAPALQVLQQREQRAFASVQRHVIEEVEHTWLAQLAQLGVGVTAAQHGDDARVVRLHRLRDAERCVHRTREWHRDQHHPRGVVLQRLPGQLGQRLVDQVQRRGERLRQRVEGGLALRQRFGVAHELEARVDRVAQHIGNVVQVQRREVTCPVLHTERAEGPGQRVTSVVVDVDVERLEARAFGQEGAAADAVRQRGVAALQKGQRWRHRGPIAVEGFEKCRYAHTALASR